MTTKKVAIVTGANTGIGRETALGLAKENIKVFITCRSVDKGRASVVYIQESYPDADVEMLVLDLSSMESVRRCAAEFKSRKLPLHILVNNAGASLKRPWYTAEGVGGSAQVNFLGPYTLTRLLEEELTLGAPSRVVNVSSIRHRHATIPEPEKFLGTFEASLYSQCKLANVLFTHEAQRLWQGQGIESSAVDPGAVWSDIWNKSILSKPPYSWILKFAYAPTWDGAKTVIHAAIKPYDPPKQGQFRFFARGAFASPLITHQFPGQLVVHLFGSLIDWPVRKFSRGLFFSEVKDVRAAPSAYDKVLASTLWKLAAVAAGFDGN